MIASEIFERGVQDPFCQDCDYEDETDAQTFLGSNDFVNSKLASFSFENSSKNNIFRASIKTNVGNASKHRGSHTIGHHLRKIKTAPHHLCGFASPNSTNNSNESTRPSPRRIRANSSTFIHQLSRQSTRQSSLDDTVDSCFDHKCIKTRSRHSSCYGIPTHLYGLEKYVSSELDSLAVTNDQSNDSTSPLASNSTPALNSNSCLNLNSNCTAFPSSVLSSEKNNRLKLISHGKISSNVAGHSGNPYHYCKERRPSNLRAASSSILSTGSSSSPLQTRKNSYSNSLVKSSSNSSLNTSVGSSNEESVPHSSNNLEERNPRRKSFIKLSLASSFSN